MEEEPPSPKEAESYLTHAQEVAPDDPDVQWNLGVLCADHLDDPERAITVWSSIDTVTNGLGGGNELVGGIWILLVSTAGFAAKRLPQWLNVVGVVTAVAGVFTVVPAFDAIEMVFGLGSIAWFIGAGVTLLRDREPAEAT